MSNVTPITPKLIVDNTQSSIERVSEVYSAMSQDKQIQDTIIIAFRTDMTITYHTTILNPADVLYALEMFKMDLLSGRLLRNGELPPEAS